MPHFTGMDLVFVVNADGTVTDLHEGDAVTIQLLDARRLPPLAGLPLALEVSVRRFIDALVEGGVARSLVVHPFLTREAHRYNVYIPLAAADGRVAVPSDAVKAAAAHTLPRRGTVVRLWKASYAEQEGEHPLIQVAIPVDEADDMRPALLHTATALVCVGIATTSVGLLMCYLIAVALGVSPVLLSQFGALVVILLACVLCSCEGSVTVSYVEESPPVYIGQAVHNEYDNRR